MKENNIAENHDDLVLLKDQKMATFFKVKDTHETITKDVDFGKRTVKAIPNTYLFFDSDQDVLIPGCAAKTFRESGPKSDGSAKIKNVKDHNISTRIGAIQVLDEREVDGKQVQYGESKMLTTDVGNNMLIEYQEGVIDQHSIGFRYLDLEFLTNESAEWKKWIDQLINPKEAEATGYMFLVKEIRMYEYSPVSFGANKLTPYLGVKSGNKDAILLKVNDRIDLLNKQLRHGKQTDDAMLDYDLECAQLKQIISELFTPEPSIKAALIEQHRQNNDTTKQTEEKFDWNEVRNKIKL